MATVITLKPISDAELRKMRAAARRQEDLATPKLRSRKVPSGKVYNRRKSNKEDA